MAERENQYAIDAVKALAIGVIKKLWIIIFLLILLLFITNAAWVYYEFQFANEIVTQEVTQDASGGNNEFVGGDYYGNAKDQNNN